MHLIVVSVKFLSIFSGSPKADTRQPFVVGPVAKSEKARLFLSTSERIVRHLGPDLHTLAILCLTFQSTTNMAFSFPPVSGSLRPHESDAVRQTLVSPPWRGQA
jgi:hypothetical protein